MMHISEVHDYDGEPHEEKVNEFLSEGHRKGIKTEIERIFDDVADRMEEYAGEYLSQLAASRAEKFLEKVLSGDDDAAMALLGDRMGGDRYRLLGADANKPWARLIHGRLFESGGLALRRQIVDAHAELLKNERIKDLESVVDGLSQQIRKIEADLERQRMS